MRVSAMFGALLCWLAPCNPLFAQEPTHPNSGVDVNALDRTADPCLNFYQYACGTWLKNNPIPPDQSTWSRFNELFERNQKALREVAEDAAANQSRSPLDQRVGGFYAACMDENAVEQNGLSPLRPELERIAALADKKALVAEVARLHAQQVPVLFVFGPQPDPDNSRQNIARIDQGGLGLPERDYYLRTDAKSIELRQKYVAHIARMLQLAGDDEPTARKKADQVMALETALAKGSLDITSRRDPHKLVHKMDTAQLASLSPHFAFTDYFASRGAAPFQIVNLATPDFVKALDEQLSANSLDNFKVYLSWHYLHANAELLSRAFAEENFQFQEATLRGVKQMRPRWKRCVQLTDQQLGEALGQKYVEKTFGQEGKQRTLELVAQIERQMAVDIDSLTWMSAATKQEALVKLRGVTNKIGFPDHWRDYSSVSVAPGDAIGNLAHTRQFEAHRQLVKIGKPVDRSEWGMTPPTVNAYYSPQQDNINFPAGILQPPFYKKDADPAVNYGGIGAVVGHELTHGFDDQGRQFDADGNLRDWWKPEDAQQFRERADCVVKEYGSFSPLPGLNLNGRLTLGENAADNGGLRLAYMALMASLASHTVSATALDGFTPAQRFFIGWGQIWCTNARDEALRLRTQTDPHSPGEFRVNGTVRNMPEFRQAFGCKENQPMAPAGGACRIW